jgi:hypothetical protein
MRTLWGLLISATLFAQDLGLSPESLLLARVKLRMSKNLARQPNYTCLETVERTQRPKGGRANVVDTLRLEVALVNGKEMFAWPGAKKFEDKEIRDLVATGTFGNGNFAIFARAVFLTNGPSFQSRGQDLLNGRSAVRYDFRVLRSASGYTLKVNQIEAVVGYHGTFWADPETLDLRRLEIYADDIPKYIDAESAFDRMDYAMLPIGGEPFLLPVESVLELKTSSGEHRNFMRFSGCRQYTGESVLKFTEEVTESGAPAPLAAESKEIILPKDLDLHLALNEALDLRKAAVGDEITATLSSDVRHKRQLLIPKGAVARGRISRLERHADHVVLGLRFTDLEWSDKHASFSAALEGIAGLPSQSLDPRRIPMYAPERGEGIIRLAPSQRSLIRGMLLFWRVDS